MLHICAGKVFDTANHSVSQQPNSLVCKFVVRGWACIILSKYAWCSFPTKFFTQSDTTWVPRASSLVVPSLLVYMVNLWHILLK